MIRNETIHPIEWGKIKPRDRDPKPPHLAAHLKTSAPSIMPVAPPVLSVLPDVSPTRTLFNQMSDREPITSSVTNDLTDGHVSIEDHPMRTQATSKKQKKAKLASMGCRRCSNQRRALLTSLSAGGREEQTLHGRYTDHPDGRLGAGTESLSEGADKDASIDEEGAAHWWATVVPELVAAKVPLAGEAALLFVQPPETSGSELDAIFTHLENNATVMRSATTRTARPLAQSEASQQAGLHGEAHGDLGRGRLLCTRRVIADNPKHRPRDLAIGCGGPARGARRDAMVRGSIKRRSHDGRSGFHQVSDGDVMVEETPQGGNDIIVGSFPIDLHQVNPPGCSTHRILNLYAFLDLAYHHELLSTLSF